MLADLGEVFGQHWQCFPHCSFAPQNLAVCTAFRVIFPSSTGSSTSKTEPRVQPDVSDLRQNLNMPSLTYQRTQPECFGNTGGVFGAVRSRRSSGSPAEGFEAVFWLLSAEITSQNDRRRIKLALKP